MKQYIKFSYTEEYLPTPRCKKLREREVKSSTSINIKECSKEDAPLVMVVKSYNCEECEIRVFKGKLYRNVQWRNMNRADGEPIEQNETINTINWQFIIWGNDYYNDSRWTGERGDATSKANIKKRASKYLIIGDMVFMRTTEPIYNITCFGCNDSAGMFVDYADKDSTYCYNYSALQREECHEELFTDFNIFGEVIVDNMSISSYDVSIIYDVAFEVFKRCECVMLFVSLEVDYIKLRFILDEDIDIIMFNSINFKKYIYEEDTELIYSFKRSGGL